MRGQRLKMRLALPDVEPANMALGLALAGVAAMAGQILVPSAPVAVLALQLLSGLAGALVVQRTVARDRSQAETAARELALLKEAIAVTPTPFAVYDSEDWLLAWNDSYEQIHAAAFTRLRPPVLYGDLVREGARGRVPADALEAYVAERVSIQRRGDGSVVDRLYPDGRWVRVTKKRTRSGAIVGLAADITELKQREAALAASEARYRALAESAPVGIWQVRVDGVAIYANPAMRELLGLPPDAIWSLPSPGAVVHLDGVDAPWAIDSLPQGARQEARLEAVDGKTHDVLIAASAWIGENASELTRLLTVVDITQLKLAERAIRQIAHIDPLTGLANRAAFTAALERALTIAAEHGQSMSLLAIDLDRFKAVNDTYGHAAGDTVLHEAARRIQCGVREGDAAFRFGGDEFAVILPDADEAAGEAVAGRILDALIEPFRVSGNEMVVGASIGIASTASPAAQSEDLMKQADLALYDAKRSGRSRWRSFPVPFMVPYGRARPSRPDG